jgi:hypothetical protein
MIKASLKAEVDESMQEYTCLDSRLDDELNKDLLAGPRQGELAGKLCSLIARRPDHWIGIPQCN